MGNEFFTVRMLGDFSIVCGGKEVVLGRKSTSKFIQMLQLVWLRGDKGITKERLQKILYERSDVSDSNNSLNNLLYELRRQMVKAGFPKGEYISRIDGLFIPDKAFLVKLDVRDFEELIAQAEQAGEEKEKCACYREAFELYRGEFLPALCTEIWVMTQSLKLKNKFDSCVKWLGEYYRKQGDYTSLHYLYERAAKMYPYENWQIYQIDVFLENGEYRRAHTIYNEMVRCYSEEMGLPPTVEMLNCFERINQSQHQMPGEMDRIKREILTGTDQKQVEKSAFYCSYCGFVDICNMSVRNMERTERSACLVLCTLVDYEGKRIQNHEKLKTRSIVMREVLGECLRKGDAFTQYGNSQYLLLLPGTDKEHCEGIFRRISGRLKERAGSRAEIKYEILPLEELQSSLGWI